jgi:hypothetical protein
MKLFFLIFTLLYIPFAWASDECKKQAQRSVEIAEDYKNYSELMGDVHILRAQSGGETGEALARNEHKIRLLLIYGESVFFHSKNLKGPKLYKFTYDKCIAYEKTVSDRAARQAAREAVK